MSEDTHLKTPWAPLPPSWMIEQEIMNKYKERTRACTALNSEISTEILRQPFSEEPFCFMFLFSLSLRPQPKLTRVPAWRCAAHIAHHVYGETGPSNQDSRRNQRKRYKKRKRVVHIHFIPCIAPYPTKKSYAVYNPINTATVEPGFRRINRKRVNSTRKIYGAHQCPWRQIPDLRDHWRTIRKWKLRMPMLET